MGSPLSVVSSRSQRPDAPHATFRYVVDRLGVYDRGQAWQLKYVRKVIAERDFPAPLPTLRGEQLTDAVVPSSTWVKSHVDAWFDDLLPPRLALVIDRAEDARIAAALDARAAQLGGAAA
jgi:hypothetical protein